MVVRALWFLDPFGLEHDADHLRSGDLGFVFVLKVFGDFDVLDARFDDLLTGLEELSTSEPDAVTVALDFLDLIKRVDVEPSVAPC